MLGLDGRIDLANMALILVLGAGIAAIWSTPWASLAASAIAVLAFNFVFVPPRRTFAVDLHQHALLLATMLTVSWIVALLVARLRWHTAQATAQALRSDQLREFAEAQRAADEPAAQASILRDALSTLTGAEPTLLLADASVDTLEGSAFHSFGPATPDESIGLRLCLQEQRPMGPGTGRHEEQPAWYLPLRGLSGGFGAALIRRAAGDGANRELRDHVQALCDQLGAALERGAALRAAAAAREQAQDHALRNTLLTAISHDHRTPLATILGAASALHDQDERLSGAQRRRLASTIVDEATQLARLTDNTLQLARLGQVGLALRRDWESVEELVGTVLRRLRQRDPHHRVKARVEAGLPLLRCDAVLMVQLLDNLVDNALKHGAGDAPVEVVARRVGAAVLIAVRDRGPGVPVAQRKRIFEAFHRGERVDSAEGGDPHSRPGAGVGLALCRAIARVHGGELRLRIRGHGGSSFEMTLPVDDVPEGTEQDGGEGAPP
jgi:two-component system, OmpR family, sensor histidine kinase KdpD